MTEHLNRFDLLARRWTPGMIRELLGNADAQVPHPRLRAAPPVDAYDRQRVEEIERTDRFDEARKRANDKSSASRDSMMRKAFPSLFPVRREINTEVVEGRVAVVVVQRTDIASLSAELARSAPDGDAVLDRILETRVRCSAAVNDRSYGARRRTTAILKEVARTYPELIDECSARLRRMGEPGL